MPGGNRMAVLNYPPGMTLIAVEGQIIKPGGTKPASGYIRAEAERKFGYVGTGWAMQRYTGWIPLSQGRFSLVLPHSDQAGLIGDAGAALSAPPAYKIELRLTNDTAISVLAWTALPTSLGAQVNYTQLANLGGWPNATVVLNPPATTTNVIYVPDPDLADRGLFYPTNDGTY